MRELTVSDGDLYLLSPKEKAVLEVICEAEKPLTTLEICERAGCNVRTYQRLMRRKNFRSLLAPCLNYMIESSLIPIFGSLLSKSRAGSQKHQELLFRVLGFLRENKQEIYQILNVFGAPEDQKYLTDERISELLGDE